MILGLGTDIVAIERFEKSITNPSFLKKIYTKAEIEYCTPKGAASFAGIFAAKEAVAKALGTGFSGGFAPTDIEITHTPGGTPVATTKTPHRLAISIAHEKTHATATAILFT